MNRLPKVPDDAPEVELETSRYGYTIDGEFYRRVTTHLRGLPKPWLGGWAAKAVAEFAVEHAEEWKNLPKTDAVKLLKGAPWSQRDDAADRGSAVHAAIESYVKGTALPDGLTEDEFDCAVAAEAWLRKADPFVFGAEVTVFSRTHEYAGTLDLWCAIEGVPWVIDWKTSGDVYVDHAVQQVAYRTAEYAVVAKERVGKDRWKGRAIPWGPDRASRLGIVHVRPDGAELHPIKPVEIDRMWTVFRAAKHVKQWQADVDDYRKTPKVRVYGDPLFEVRTKQETRESEEAA